MYKINFTSDGKVFAYCVSEKKYLGTISSALVSAGYVVSTIEEIDSLEILMIMQDN